MKVRAVAMSWFLAALLALVPTARGQCPPEWIAPPQPDAAAPAIVGEILCSTLWNNTLVVGGTFTSIGGGQYNRIALWDGTAWRLVGPFAGMNGEVRTLEVDWNGNLIAGGTFTSAGGVNANRIARFNGTSWSAIGAGITSPGGEVNAIERVTFQGSESLYVGGAFADAGGIAGVNNIVRIDAANAYSIVGTANFHGTEGTVHAIHYNTHVWVGGTFAGVRLNTGILTSPRVALFSLFTGAWSNAPVLSGTGVYAISSGFINGQQQIIIGGEFRYGLSAADRYVAYTLVAGAGSSWTAMGSLNGTVRGMSYPYVVGDFTGDSTGAIPHVARWNSSLGRWEALGGGVDARANSVSSLFGAVYIGGAFDNAGGVGGVAAPRIAQWDGEAWSRLRPRPSGPVNALYPLGSALYVGGSFDQSTGSGESAHNIVAISAGGYSKLDTITGFNGTNGPVNAVVFQDRGVQIGNIVVAGSFSQAGGAAASNYSAFRTGTWTSSLNFDGPVNAVINYGCTVSGCGIVSTGGFSSVNGVSASNIARNNTALGSGLNGVGRALAIYGGSLIVGGDFTTAGGVPASRLAQWNGTTWSAFNGASLNGSVYAMKLWNSQLVVAGSFTQINGQTVNGIARWDGAAWQPFGSGVSTSSLEGVRALAVHNGDLYAGGTSSVNVRRWTGAAWQLVDPSFNGTVNALASFGGNLWAGGSFTTVAGLSIPYLAASRTPGTGSACPADVNNSGGLTIQDIFDYLALWFNGNCLADFNHAGGITVQDLFDFLNAWFAGC